MIPIRAPEISITLAIILIESMKALYASFLPQTKLNMTTTLVQLEDSYMGVLSDF